MPLGKSGRDVMRELAALEDPKIRTANQLTATITA
jgi:hypothetical protein